MNTENAVASKFIVKKTESYLYDGLYVYSALEYDAATGEFNTISLGGGYDGPSAEWYATSITTDEGALAAYELRNRNATARMYARSRLDTMMTEAAAITKGKLVEVVAGRKVAKGTRGIVFWVEGEGYNRLGMNVEGQSEPVWTYVKNVKVADLEDHDLPTLSELTADYLAPKES